MQHHGFRIDMHSYSFGETRAGEESGMMWGVCRAAPLLPLMGLNRGNGSANGSSIHRKGRLSVGNPSGSSRESVSITVRQ
jgi:hypothetical protein